MSKENSKGRQSKYLKNFINLLTQDLHALIFHIQSNFRKIISLYDKISIQIISYIIIFPLTLTLHHIRQNIHVYKNNF